MGWSVQRLPVGWGRERRGQKKSLGLMRGMVMAVGDPRTPTDGGVAVCEGVADGLARPQVHQVAILRIIVTP